jgi:predicted transcriptional regulator
VSHYPRRSWPVDELEAKLLGQQIKLRRLRLAMTQEDLDRASGVDQGSISEIENGEIVPQVMTLIRLVVALDGDLGIHWRS